MKIALVVALAAWFSRADWERVGKLRFLLVPVLAVLAPVGLILKEPNLGTAVITALVGGAMFMAAGVRLWLFGGMAAAGGGGGTDRVSSPARLSAGADCDVSAPRAGSAGRRL